jgi:hypothetical protein
VDGYPRALFHDRFLGPLTTLDNLRRGQHAEAGDFVDSPYQLIDVEDEEGNEIVIHVAREGVCLDGKRERLVRVAKRYRFFRDRRELELRYELTNRVPETFHARFAVELNLNVDSAVQDRALELPDGLRLSLEASFEREDTSAVHLVLPDRRRRISVRCGVPAHLYHYPVRTPVRTLSGYRAGFQGSCLLLAWKTALWGNEKCWFDVYLGLEET